VQVEDALYYSCQVTKEERKRSRGGNELRLIDIEDISSDTVRLRGGEGNATIGMQEKNAFDLLATSR
jgi:hypothetical protein